MASDGFEDVRKRSTGSLDVQAKAAVLHVRSGRAPSDTPQRRDFKPAVTSVPSVQHQPPGSHFSCAFPFVPASSSIVAKTECARSAEAKCAKGVFTDGDELCGVDVKCTQNAEVPLINCQSLHLDSLRFRSGLLGKRAFSHQAIYNVCPSPPKATSHQIPEGVLQVKAMPTNPTPPWSPSKFRHNTNGVIQSPSAQVPALPRDGLGRASAVHSKIALSQFGDDNVDEEMNAMLVSPMVPLHDNCQNVVLEALGAEESMQCEEVVTEETECTSKVFSASLKKVMENGELHGSRSPTLTSVSALEGITNASSCHMGRLPPARPPAHCLNRTSPEARLSYTDSTSSPSSEESCSSPSIEENLCQTSGSFCWQGEGDSPLSPSVYSVTTQISAIHLAKQSCDYSPIQEGQGDAGNSILCQEKDFAPLAYGEDDELSEELEHNSSGDEDAQSVCSSMNDTSSTTSLVFLSSVEEPLTSELEGGQVEKPALVPSMFSFVSPTLYFSSASERVELLPLEQRQLLKWKMSSVTPNVVKHIIARSHFGVTKNNYDWLGCWGHHMKSPVFKTIRDYQKLNHFPGSFQIGRKDRLWRNLSKMQIRFGKREFGFFPRSFILPQDIKHLRKAWEDGGGRQKWIIKPPASARGLGIQVIHKWSQLPQRKPLLVQKYLHKPYLINGSKFDLRIYVQVTSYDPLRIYIYNDGLVRFASCKYSSSMKSLGNKYIHLTNYSVNRKNTEYQSNSDDKACQGHKWTLRALWQYLGSNGVNAAQIWEKIKDMVIKTIIVSDPYVNSLVKQHVHSPYSCYELFGFDIMLDVNLKPWVLEVNISPSLHSSTALDVAVKGQMIQDVLNLAGFVLPQPEEVTEVCHNSCSSFCGVKHSKRVTELSNDEKFKRAYFLSQRAADQEFFSSVLEVLTPSDIRALVESEDELNRRGEFERLFPSPTSSRYLRFFEQPRYLNILLNQWEQKYWQNRSKGTDLLKSFCHTGVHMGQTTAPAHIWSLRSSSSHKLESCHTIFSKLEPMTSSVLLGDGDNNGSETPSSSDTADSSPCVSLQSTDSVTDPELQQTYPHHTCVCAQPSATDQS